MEINWTKIFDQVRAIIDVIVTRFYEVKDWLSPYIKED